MQPYDYEVVKAASIRRIEEQVNEKLASGFILAGGVSTSTYEGVTEYYQALYRERAWPQP